MLDGVLPGRAPNKTMDTLFTEAYRKNVESHPAQKVIRKLINNPNFKDDLIWEIEDVANLMEAAQTPHEKRLWDSYSDEEKDLIRKANFNLQTDNGRTLVSEFIRVNMVRRCNEGIYSLLAGALEIRSPRTKFAPSGLN